MNCYEYWFEIIIPVEMLNFLQYYSVGRNDRVNRLTIEEAIDII
jgi:hypothetical protein